MTEPYPFLSTTKPVCPTSLLSRARALPRPRVALVNAGAAHPLNGIREAAEAGLADPILIGDTAKITATAAEIGWNISIWRKGTFYEPTQSKTHGKWWYRPPFWYWIPLWKLFYFLN